jgi:hypothetical protein
MQSFNLYSFLIDYVIRTAHEADLYIVFILCKLEQNKRAARALKTCLD